MAIITTDSQHYSDIADAIRGKNGTQNTYLPSEMATAITNIPSGGPTVTVEQLNVTSNDTYTAPSGKAYSPVVVNVPVPSGYVDVSDTTATAPDVATGKIFYGADGTQITGTGEDTLLKALRNEVTSVSDDTLTSIRSYGLAYMTALTSVSFPNLQTINSYAFYNDSKLVMNGWIFPKAKTIGNYAFRYNYGLTGEVTLPSTVTSIGQYSFASCKNMTKFTATGAITTLGTYTFVGASADHKMTVTEIHMPNLGTGIALNLNFGSTTAANACQQLKICDVGKAKSIAANTFANCYALDTLILRRTSVTTLANVSAFLNTPMRGRNSMTGTIYVPEALIDTYKAASVWSTLYGYGYVTFSKIEDSVYEL